MSGFTGYPVASCGGPGPARVDGPAPWNLRSEIWFNDRSDPAETSIYIERLGNFGMTRGELQSGRPVIGIAQTGNDLVPCNRIHLTLVERVKAGIRDAGGIPLEFPVHPLQETMRRPTAALDRNLAALGLVEILAGYPFDGVVLTTGCDKTTPACLMAAATVDIPAIVLSGGPMLDGWFNGRLAGSGVVLWEARRQVAEGRITEDVLVDRVFASATSAGHCNTMGTALSMNSLAEALGMSLPGCAAVPAPYAERGRYAYETGFRAVEMVREGLKPSKILTREAFENAIVVASAIGGSTNCPPHINAIAAHMGVPLTMADWDRVGYDVNLIVNVQPAGEYLGEGFYRAGGVPAVMGELLRAGKVHGDALRASGRTVAEEYLKCESLDREVIRTYREPLKHKAGLLVMSGNLFDSAVLKTSVISDDFRRRYLSELGSEGVFTARVIVFDGPEDYRKRIDDPALEIDERSILVIRNAGPLGYPGSAEVVNMVPPKSVLDKGVRMLPCLGDGRQSGTSDSPSIVNVSPEAAAGGRIGLLRDGDEIRIDLVKRRVDVLWTDEEVERRLEEAPPFVVDSHTPWEELFRAHVSQLGDGAVLDFAVAYHDVGAVVPRHSH